jgi:hypothetical protein
MLKVTNDGRKAALEIRLVKPDAPRPAQSKVMALVENYDTPQNSGLAQFW